jgi:hypothetical protein
MHFSILSAITILASVAAAAPAPVAPAIAPHEKRFQPNSPWIWRGDAGEVFDKREPQPKAHEKRFQSESPWIWAGDAGEALDKRENDA